MATMENLKAAFAGESQANRTYLAFAKKAEAEQKPQIAKLFRAAAEAETIHAHAHLRVMGGVKTTQDNLQAAIDGEGYEFKEMYPAFLAQAQAENNQPAIITFRNALAVEKVHHDLYTQALHTLQAGNDLPARKVFICSICGNTVFDQAEDKCNVCGAGREKFVEIK